MARYLSDPRWITAKFNSECKCGARITKGQRIFYYPNGRTALCAGCGEKAAAEFAACAQDEASYNGQCW